MLNTTIDDASPLINYQPDGFWTQSVSNEALAGGYTNTTWQNASATFQFWGTWVMVTGSKNDYHGGYTVELDGFKYPLNGSEPYPGEWKAPLFVSEHLADDELHTLTITNDEWLTLDIDSITWTCDVGERNATNSPLQNTTVDDGEGAFSWFPQGAWGMNPSNLTMFSQETGHSTSQVNASVNYTFIGDAVSIYGSAGPGHSSYSVWPPHRSAQEFDASRDTFSPQVLLYFGDGFGPGNHTVTLKNEGSGLFQVDYAVVHTAVVQTANTLSLSPTSVIPPTSTGPPALITGTVTIPPDSIHRGLSAGIIAAITLTALLFVFLIAALLFLLQRNKTLWDRVQRGYKVQSQFDVGSPPNGSVSPLPFTAAPPPMRSKANLRQDNDDDDFEAQPLNRAYTTESHLTASTLVADAGSNTTRVGRPFSLKALRLASRWGPNTPTSSQTNLSDMRQSVSSRRFTLPPTTQHLSRPPSVRHLLQEDSQYYDPYAAAVAGLEEVPEDSIAEVLRHPIRRNEPSTYNHWQTGLP
jgi:hypothetical protein